MDAERCVWIFKMHHHVHCAEMRYNVEEYNLTCWHTYTAQNLPAATSYAIDRAWTLHASSDMRNSKCGAARSP